VILGTYVMRPLRCNPRSARCPLLTLRLADVNRVLFTDEAHHKVEIVDHLLKWRDGGWVASSGLCCLD